MEINEVTPGDVIRFIPRAMTNVVTVRVTGAYDGVAVMGFRCRVYPEQGVVRRGRENAYLAHPRQLVEYVGRT